MGLEIERKFRVVGDAWRDDVESQTPIMQGYLAATGQVAVRVRVKGDSGYLTIKGATTGVTRAEFEYPIDVSDARAMLETLASGPIIDKVRYVVPVGGHRWEVDVFSGDNEGLVVAEIELASADEEFILPPWAGKEVSDDPRYFNVNLVEHPYRTWADT